ncbi:uncharacterized protein J4E79_002607 [Alternaria viburni]|uniref:uncharacterized protein n=1 Tax=Alternaria viburni TaxID=566460 RepID=UPI0020C50323|nr:uncharacterized protein J4E79_002607 [Alternaria viburni]KAI4666568.1 hypothetical protein J4E79_002607 [Alternaria viburni]
MSFLGDLFSCGRARRTRETSTEPLETNDATPEPSDAHGTTATTLHPTIEKPNDIPAPNEDRFERVANPVSASVRSGAESRGSRNDDVELAVISEKSKPSAGWMVEQRVLVTATSATKQDTSSVAEEQEPRHELEQKHDEEHVRAVTPPVRCATPEQEPWNSTPVAYTQVEPEVRDTVAAAPVRCATPEPETRAITPEQQPEPSTPSVHDATPELAIDEVASTSSEVDDVVEDVATPKKTAPLCFLDMPPEIRNRIYERMSEEVPIRMCRHDDPALVQREGEATPTKRRQYYNLTQVCHQLREEFLPIYAEKAHYIIDLWSQKSNLVKIDSLKGHVSLDIDAACFDMEPIDLLPLIRCLVRTRRTDCRFTSTEGVVFRSISEIVGELNKLLPNPANSNQSWLTAVNGPMKRIDLHLFPHDDIRQYYRFRGAEPLLRVVYPSAVSEEWMKRASKSEGYEAYLQKTGLDKFEMHVVIGHASRRTTNEGRLPLDWRMSYQLSRHSIDSRAPRMSMDIAAARMSIDRAPRMS